LIGSSGVSGGVRALVASALLAVSTFAAAAYPDKPIRLVVGYPPAGANDLIARHVAGKLGPLLNTQVVVDNRAGANGVIACELVAAPLMPFLKSGKLRGVGITSENRNPELTKAVNIRSE
jgi:tripartite-type tricarboxylate transporter receptor subunit TctC